MYVTTSFLCPKGMPEDIHERMKSTVKCGAKGGIMPDTSTSYLSTIFFNATQSSVDEALALAVLSGCTVSKLSEKDIRDSKDSNISFAKQAYRILPPKQ